MTVHEDLIVARRLIDTPDKWCRFVLVDDKGRLCAAGALALATGQGGDAEVHYVAARSALECQIGSVSSFNDRSTHAKLLAAFDRAIAATAPERGR